MTKPARQEYPEHIRWRGNVRHDQLTGAQLLARLRYLRRRLDAALRLTPGATAEHERWRKWIRRYEGWVDQAAQ